MVVYIIDLLSFHEIYINVYMTCGLIITLDNGSLHFIACRQMKISSRDETTRMMYSSSQLHFKWLYH